MSASTGQGGRPGALGTLGVRLVNFSSILAVGTGAGLMLAMVRIAVLTRLLEISVYGQLALLVIMAGFVTMAVRMAIVTGALLSAFRGGDDDTGAEEGAEDEPDPGFDQRRVLGTGLVASLLLTAGLVAGVAVLAGPIDEMLIDSGVRSAVILATLLGGLDGAFRLVAHISRFERRPATFVALQLTHAILGLAAAILLIEAGYGLEGAIGGLALGTALAFIPGLWVSRHRFSLSVDLGYLGRLAGAGAPLIAITGGFWLFRHADLFIVSRYLPEADVALYRVAGRVGAITASLVGGVLFAWGPLMRGPLRGALHREGLLDVAGARLLTYFWLIAVWLIVALVLTKDLLIRIAPAEYAGASTLIALLGAAALAVSALIVVYRTSRMNGKRLMLVGLLTGMSPVLVGLSMVLIPRFGLEGAAAASIATPLVSAAVYLSVSQRTSPAPLDVRWSKLALGTLAGAGYGAICLTVADAIGGAAIAFSIVAALGFPVALVLSGALPREDARAVARLLVRLSQRGGSRLADGLTLLDAGDLEVLDSLLRDRRAPGEVARAIDQSEEELLQRFVLLLREVGEIGRPRPADDLIGQYLLSPRNVNLRDREGHLLALEDGVDSMEVDELTALSDRISKLSDRRWLALTGGDDDG